MPKFKPSKSGFEPDVKKPRFSPGDLIILRERSKWHPDWNYSIILSYVTTVFGLDGYKVLLREDLIVEMTCSTIDNSFKKVKS